MTDDAPSERLLDTQETRRLVKRGETRFSQLINDPDAGFPRPILLHGSKHYFVESEVIAWLRAQPRVPIKAKPAPKPLPEFWTKAGQGTGKPRGRRPATPKSESEQPTTDTTEAA
jgi:predicted DNA-binding transcriptional regulator AlpA